MNFNFSDLPSPKFKIRILRRHNVKKNQFLQRERVFQNSSSKDCRWKQKINRFDKFPEKNSGKIVKGRNFDKIRHLP